MIFAFIIIALLVIGVLSFIYPHKLSFIRDNQTDDLINKLHHFFWFRGTQKFTSVVSMTYTFYKKKEKLGERTWLPLLKTLKSLALKLPSGDSDHAETINELS